MNPEFPACWGSTLPLSNSRLMFLKDCSGLRVKEPEKMLGAWLVGCGGKAEAREA